MAKLVNIILQRSDEAIPWGFRLQGGADFKAPLTVQKVTPGTLAALHLNVGDTLIMIQGTDARSMCHFDAYDLIKSVGNRIELTVRKSGPKLYAENMEHQEKLEQQLVEERCRQKQDSRKRRTKHQVPSQDLLEGKETPLSPPFSTSSSRSSPPRLSSHHEPSPSRDAAFALQKKPSAQLVSLSQRQSAFSSVCATAAAQQTVTSALAHHDATPFRLCQSATLQTQEQHDYEVVSLQGMKRSLAREAVLQDVTSPTVAQPTVFPSHCDSTPYSTSTVTSPSQDQGSSHYLSPPLQPTSGMQHPIPLQSETCNASTQLSPPSVREGQREKPGVSSVKEASPSLSSGRPAGVPFLQQSVFSPTASESQGHPQQNHINHKELSAKLQFLQQQEYLQQQQMAIQREQFQKQEEEQQRRSSECGGIQVTEDNNDIFQHLTNQPQKTLKDQGNLQRLDRGKSAGPEDEKRRALQQMIQEKLRLEELMMIAKRREGERTSKQERQQESLAAEESFEENKLLLSDSKREVEEEQRLREENRIRDEQIRRMQRSRLEKKKLQRDTERTIRESSCPADYADRRQLRKNKTEEKIASPQLSRIDREGSCPANPEEFRLVTIRKVKTGDFHQFQNAAARNMDSKEKPSELQYGGCPPQQQSDYELSPERLKEEARRQIEEQKRRYDESVFNLHRSHNSVQEYEGNALAHQAKRDRDRKTLQKRLRLDQQKISERMVNQISKEEKDGYPEERKNETKIAKEAIKAEEKKKIEALILREEKMLLEKKRKLEEEKRRKQKTSEANLREEEKLTQLKIKEEQQRKRESKESRKEFEGMIKPEQKQMDREQKETAEHENRRREQEQKRKEEQNRKIQELRKKALEREEKQREEKQYERIKMEREQSKNEKERIQSAEKRKINPKQKIIEEQKPVEKRTEEELLKMDKNKLLNEQKRLEQQRHYEEELRLEEMRKSKERKEKEALRRKEEQQMIIEIKKLEEEKLMREIKRLEEQRRVEEEKWREQQKRDKGEKRKGDKAEILQEYQKQELEQRTHPRGGLEERHYENLPFGRERRGSRPADEILEEEKLDDMKRKEKAQMREEARQYEEYLRHIEDKRRAQLSDSDDYASEWDVPDEDESAAKNGAEIKSHHGEETSKLVSDAGKVSGEPKKSRIELVEPFEEFKITSEEELYAAQEKTIRNLERQIQKQREREQMRLMEKKQGSVPSSHPKPRSSQQAQQFAKVNQHHLLHEQGRQCSSMGDLSRPAARTVPVIKFSPDPMEFGFRPISRTHDKLSKSTGYLSSRAVSLPPASTEAAAEFGTVGPANASLLSAEDLIDAGELEDRPSTDAFDSSWENLQLTSHSLGDLQQISAKPPLPSAAVRPKGRMRHAASEEAISRTSEARLLLREMPYYASDGDIAAHGIRRYSYADGEDLSNLDSLNLEILDFGRLLNEYYSAYYDAYYQSYYRRQQEEQKEGRMSAGPPPPPPPPPLPGGNLPSTRLPCEIPQQPMKPAVPAALAGAMMKDKKPFTYTPGGFDLSEIRSPRMHRRLARNAASEGVRPSPLAQQPASSAGSSPSSSLASQGVAVQVLPMPGAGMAPVTPPPQKEVPKPKKNPCGPPPPPPPFSICGTSSQFSSASVTDSPLVISPPIPVSSPDSQSSSASPLLQPVMANEPGPSTGIPLPPPMPPTNFVQRRRSVTSQLHPPSQLPTSPVNLSNSISPPPLPKPQPVVKEPETPPENLLKNETPSPSLQEPKLSIFPLSPGEIFQQKEEPSTPVSQDLITFSPVVQEEPSIPVSQDLLSSSPVVQEAKQDASSYTPTESSRETSPYNKQSSDTSENTENISQKSASVHVKSPVGEHEEISDPNHGKALQSPLQEIMSPDNIFKEKPSTTKKQAVDDDFSVKLPEETPFSRMLASKENTPVRQFSVKDSTPVRRLSIKEPTLPNAGVTDSSDFNQITNGDSAKEIQLPLSVTSPVAQEPINILPLKPIQVTDPSPLLMQAPATDSTSTRPLSLRDTTPVRHAPIRQTSLKEPLPIRDPPTSRHITSELAQRDRKYQSSRGESPFRRMASPPPPLVTAARPTEKSRMIRQTSLPTCPTSPPVSPPTINTGSLCVSSLPGNDQYEGSIPSANRSPAISPTTGLTKAPLPWMSAQRTETASQPEFVTHTQRTLNRLQQQRQQHRQSLPDLTPVSPPALNQATVMPQPQALQHPGPVTQQVQQRLSPDKNTPVSPSALKQAIVIPHPQVLQHPGPVTKPKSYSQQQQQQQQQQVRSQTSLAEQNQPQSYQYPSHFVQSPIHNQLHQAQVPKQQQQKPHKPKERIIPIMIERDSSPPASSSGHSFPVTSPHSAPLPPGNERIIPITIEGANTTILSAPTESIHQQQVDTTGTYSLPSYPSTSFGGGAFVPYKPYTGFSGNNALEALQQMQQNLAQLNSGLQNAQYSPQQNGVGAPSTPPTGVQAPADGTPVQSKSFKLLQSVLDGADITGSDDELYGYMKRDQAPKHQHPDQQASQQNLSNSCQTASKQEQDASKPGSSHYEENDPKSDSGAVGSRFFRRLQTITNTLPEGVDPQGPVHIPILRPQQKSQEQQSYPPHATNIQFLAGNKYAGGIGATNQQKTAPEPRKYMGGNIPSRSFKVLQAMTNTNDVAGPGESDL